MNKILVSACFLGQRVRYNGKAKALSHQLMSSWQQQGRFISICPEMAGGLSVPRSPAEIQLDNSLVINSQKTDVTAEFLLGAQKALALCKKHNIRFALLKESSPSCGSQMIYDGSFSNKKISGQGITSQLLTSNGIEVFSEFNITKLAERITQAELFIR